MFEKEDKFQGLSSWLTHRLDLWRNHRNANYLGKWDEYYRLWRGIWLEEDKSRESEKSRLISPALQQAVESSVAELEEATFGRGKWFDVKDDVIDKDKSEAEAIRNLLQEDLEHTGVKDAICKVFLNAAIYGTGLAKIIVEQVTVTKPVAIPIKGTALISREVLKESQINVKVEPIAPKEFLIDPAAKTIDEALGVAHEVIKPRYHIIKGIKSGLYRDVAIEGGVYGMNPQGFDSEYQNNQRDDTIKITEYWGLIPKKFLDKNKTEDDFEYNEDDLVEAVVTLANDEYVLRAQQNIFMMTDRPFISYQHDIVPDKFWGRGVCEKGYNPQKALDAEMRARIDALALTTTPMVAADATRLPRGLKFEVRPGKTILTNGDPRQAIMPLNIGQTDMHTYQQTQALQEMIQMGTGASDHGAPDRMTSSGMSMIQSASIKRQKRTLMNFQNTFLIPMINKAMWRKIQFDVNRYPVTDHKFIPYSTMGIMAKELEIQQMVGMLQAIPKDSEAFDILLVSIFQNSSMDNRDQIVKALAPNPEQQQGEQQQMQQQRDLQMQQTQAEIAKTQAEAEEAKAKAMKAETEAMKNRPDDTAMEERFVKMNKENVQIEKIKADIRYKDSETQRNIPEVEHLRSETALNYANAKIKGSETKKPTKPTKPTKETKGPIKENKKPTKETKETKEKIPKGMGEKPDGMTQFLGQDKQQQLEQEEPKPFEEMKQQFGERQQEVQQIEGGGEDGGRRDIP